VDVRVIVATHHDLEKLVRDGKFRQDLFHRVFVFPLRLPPLRERREDIPALVEHFVSQVSTTNGWKQMRFTEDAIVALQDYAWPGNVRELKHKIESIFLCAGRQELLDRGALMPILHPGSGTVLETYPSRGLRGKVDMLKREEVLAALSRNGGNRSRAAIELGITRRHLIRLLKQIY